MSSLKNLKGLGPDSLKNLKEAGISSLEDLISYYPRRYEYRNRFTRLNEVPAADNQTLELNTVCEVTDHQFFGFGKNKTLKVEISDSGTSAYLICFGRSFLSSSLVIGKKFFIHGIFTVRFNEIQSSNFDYEPFSENPVKFNLILPVYPLTADITQNFIRKTVKAGLENYGKYIRSELPADIINENSLLQKNEALLNIHFPESDDLLQKARKTLKYEELYRFQETIIKSRLERESKKRKVRKLPLTLQNRIITSLDFELTSDQKKVIKEIYSDSVSDTCMSRVIQGDTGCGKTLAGLLSALPYIEAGYQAAFMAPTELLAKQHSLNAAKLFEGTDISIAFLSGKIPQAKKKLLLESLEAGEISLVIGTHALLSTPVKFKNLALAIVDEEHKFGVNQRERLFSKGKDIDTIMMSATPIPRTLEITMMGDLDISTIRTMPSGRMPVNTHSAYSENMQKVYDFVRRELDSGFQAYFVYPLIGESEKLDLRNAESMFREISENIFPEYRCALIHSRLPEEEKEETMTLFSSGEIKILVATSVVEVGVDVKKATCMVIEHAERFGLSSLHQLRGRIGRSSYKSYAFLVFDKNLSEISARRLKIIKKNNDGFVIAEEDLKLRGPGEVTGIRQTGFADFRIADIFEDRDLIEKSRADILKHVKQAHL